MKSFFAALACCGLGLTFHLPIGLAADWEPIDTNEESKSTTSNQVDNGRSTQWSPVPSNPGTSTKTNRQVVWTPIEPSTESAPAQPNWAGVETETYVKDPIRWKPVDPAIAQDIEEDIDNEQPIKDASVQNVAIKPPVMPSGATFANDKALWRDDTWHPQISSLVPVGFGPKGWMASFGLYGIDCTTSGICTQPKDWDDYQNQITSFGEAQYEASIAFGDAEKFIGAIATANFEETNLPIGDRNDQEEKNLLSNYYIGIHLAKNIGPDTGIRAGIKNFIDVKECGLSCGFPKSAYAVISQRLRLNANQSGWFPNAYLTAGVGNGEFRPLDEQVRESIASQRAYGCQTYGYIPDKPCTQNTLRRAVLDAANYGELTPIGSAALEVYPGFNAIGEWTGRNLNLGFSVKPFEEVGLVFTTMWNQLIENCDYGCNIRVPDYDEGVPLPENMITYRPVWSFKLSFDVKF